MNNDLLTRDSHYETQPEVVLAQIKRLADAVIAANGVGTELLKKSCADLCTYANVARSLVEGMIQSGERIAAGEADWEYFYWRHVESNLLLIWNRGYHRNDFKSFTAYDDAAKNGEGHPDKVLTAAQNLRRIVPELRKLLADTQRGKPATTPVSIREFLKECLTDKVTDRRLQSIKKAIMHAVKNRKIELPPPVAKIKKGQTPRYRPEDLRARWTGYQEVLTFLPGLRPV